MSSKTEDFPTPVSPTRRTVYGGVAVLFDVLMTPFLRDCTSLETGSELMHKGVVEPYLRVMVLVKSSPSGAVLSGP